MSHQPAGFACKCGERGWMPGVEHAPTAAKGGYGIADGAMKPDSIIVHTIEGWQATMKSPATTNSYHLTFRQDGWTVQHVSIFTPAWHAGRVDNAPPTWPLYRPGVNPNTHTVGLSAEGAANPGSPLPLAWTPEQVKSAMDAIAWIASQAGIVVSARTLGEHSSIAVLTRSDPGPRWPKADIIKALGAPSASASPNPATHTVVAGESLGAIAARYGLTVMQLATWNDIANPNVVPSGRILRLTPKTPGVPVTPAGADAAAVARALALVEQALTDTTSARHALEAGEQRLVQASRALGGDA
jgi:LysM repeat protein